MIDLKDFTITNEYYIAGGNFDDIARGVMERIKYREVTELKSQTKKQENVAEDLEYEAPNVQDVHQDLLTALEKGVDYDIEEGAPCPACGEGKGPVNRTLPWEKGMRVRYHQCDACGLHFKSVQTK